MKKEMIVIAATGLAAYSNAGGIKTNGLWTDNDWTEATKGVKVVNGIPEGTNDDMKRRIKGGQIKEGTITDCMVDPNDTCCDTLSNVQ
jgi:hypothetical protein